MLTITLRARLPGKIREANSPTGAGRAHSTTGVKSQASTWTALGLPSGRTTKSGRHTEPVPAVGSQ